MLDENERRRQQGIPQNKDKPVLGESERRQQQGTPRTMTTTGLGPRPGETSNVSHIAAEMAAQRNPLMQRAQTEGKQVANRRGLLNSSMAAGASMNAVLDRVVPMASQESQQRFQGGLSRQESAQRIREAENQGDIQSRLLEQSFGNDTSLQEQRFEFEDTQNELAFERTLRQLEKEQTFAAAESAEERAAAMDQLMQELRSDEQLALLDAETRQQLVALENESKERVAALNIEQSERENVADLFMSMNGQYQDALRSILNNRDDRDVSAADRNAFITSMQQMLDAQLIAVEGMTGVDIDFETGAFDSSGSGNPTGTGGAVFGTSDPAGVWVGQIRNNNGQRERWDGSAWVPAPAEIGG